METLVTLTESDRFTLDILLSCFQTRIDPAMLHSSDPGVRIKIHESCVNVYKRL